MQNFTYVSEQLGRLEFRVYDSVYFPREDSVMLADAIQDIALRKKNIFTGKRILEMGCGCGLVSVLLSIIIKSGISACDINPAAVRNTLLNARLHNAEVCAFQSDIFSNVRGKFDIIIFNMPYLPFEACSCKHGIREYLEKCQWSMFQKGRDIIKEFFSQSSLHLEKNGKILAVHSSLSRDFGRSASAAGYKYRKIREMKLDWERIFVSEMKIK